MPATLTYSPPTPQNSAECLRTNTRRYARYAEPHPVPPLKGLRETLTASVSYRALSPDGENLKSSFKALPDSESIPAPPPPFRHTSFRPRPRHSAPVWRNLGQHPHRDGTFTFSAKERDSETGYSYFGARYYNSDLSIWLSVDPMSDKYAYQSGYVYCANNPVKLVDPNGEELKLALRGQYDNTDNQDNNINLSNSQNSPTINWYALTPAQIAQLQTIAERNTGRASVMAKGVLCFFFGICYDDDLLVDDNQDNQDNNGGAETRSAKAVQQEGETNLNIYPNPTSGEITIQHASLHIREVEVSDMFGKLLARVSVDDFQTNLDMSPYASGVYFVRITTEQGMVTKRVVKR